MNESIAPSLDVQGVKVHLDVFEGPLDLLLYLIKKHELDIRDIPISTITEQYLGTLDLMRELNLDVAGEYLVMAATLAHIKSQMLLPQEILAEEALEEGDPRAELVRRLLEYRKYKEAADTLWGRPQRDRDTMSRGDAFVPPVVDETRMPPVDASLFDLLSALQDVLDGIPLPKFHEVQFDPISVTEKAHWLGKLMRNRAHLTLQEIFRGTSRRVDVIATFLAILEMARLKLVRVVQDEMFGTLQVVSNLPEGQDPSEFLEQVDLDSSFAYASAPPVVATVGEQEDLSLAANVDGTPAVSVASTDAPSSEEDFEFSSDDDDLDIESESVSDLESDDDLDSEESE